MTDAHISHSWTHLYVHKCLTAQNNRTERRAEQSRQQRSVYLSYVTVSVSHESRTSDFHPVRVTVLLSESRTVPCDAMRYEKKNQDKVWTEGGTVRVAKEGKGSDWIGGVSSAIASARRS